VRGLNPVVKGSITNNIQLADPRSIAVSGRYAYVAMRQSVGGRPEFAVIDISNPALPVIVGTSSPYDDPLFRSVTDIAVSGKYVYAVTQNGSNDYIRSRMFQSRRIRTMSAH